MQFQRVLVVEDDPALRRILVAKFQKREISATGVATVRQAIEEYDRQSADLMLVDYQLPDGDGLNVIQAVKNFNLDTEIIMMTGHGTIERAIEAMRLGAANFLLKPFSSSQFEIALDQLLKNRRHKSENLFLKEGSELIKAEELLKRSPQMESLLESVSRVAGTDATVLIEGESGTGKELIAQMLHEQSRRSDKPYIKLNCAAIPHNLLESEFFGHEKGAFTGATHRREGRFQLANGGTLLLDEITEMPLSLQSKLLRVLQEQQFERVGGNCTFQVDVRMIATTNRRLLQAVSTGEFREDLYFRLNVVSLKVPPLRQRKGAVEFHLNDFIRKFARQHSKPVPRITPLALEQLICYPWPGNLRELKNCCERAVVLADGIRELELKDFGLGICANENVVFQGWNEFPTLEEIEKRLITLALRSTSGQRKKAAKLLGIHVRTLRNKLQSYQIDPE